MRQGLTCDMALEGCGWGAGAASLAVGEVGLEEFDGVGHVGPAEADSDVVWLVVDRAQEEQYADLGADGLPAGRQEHAYRRLGRVNCLTHGRPTTSVPYWRGFAGSRAPAAAARNLGAGVPG